MRHHRWGRRCAIALAGLPAITEKIAQPSPDRSAHNLPSQGPLPPKSVPVVMEPFHKRAVTSVLVKGCMGRLIVFRMATHLDSEFMKSCVGVSPCHHVGLCPMASSTKAIQRQHPGVVELVSLLRSGCLVQQVGSQTVFQNRPPNPKGSDMTPRTQIRLIVVHIAPLEAIKCVDALLRN